MDLQQGQLDSLAAWLAKMEAVMAKEEQVGSDLQTIRKQVDEHKVFLTYLRTSPFTK